MNNLIKIICFIVSIIFIIILYYLFCNIYNKNYLTDSNIPLKFNYLTITEKDLNFINIPTRWLYRSQCLKYFNLFKNDYSLINYRYPLPKSLQNGLIFVNLASYRDSECPNTINSLIYNSNNWKNLRIYVCQQNSEEDPDALSKLDPKYKGIVFINRVSYKDARGPTRARFLIQQKYNQEEYYLQIDAHTLFEKDWDLKLINTLKELPPKSCLTQYLPSYERGEIKN